LLKLMVCALSLKPNAMMFMLYNISHYGYLKCFTGDVELIYCCTVMS
jgi:hypothetical protein